MSKPVKDLIIRELKSHFADLDSAVVVNPIALTATENNQLRRALKAKNITMELVKNSLASRALADTALAKVGELLYGPSALVSGGDSPVEVARELFAWTKKLTKLEIRGAVVEGQVVDAQGVEVLSKLPNRVELQGQLVTLFNSPGARLASCIAAPGARIAGCIKARVEKLEETSGAEAA
jgi:large subunit ribosomal protein L10